MKKLYLFCFALYSIMGQGQSGTGAASISADMPNITPPSPTVASLMKFEQVPVDNYTGTPDISIPLFSVGTLSKDLAVDLGLKYHPSSIAIKEVAAYTGLGWNLVGAGTISRTVQGLPDEIYKPGNSNGLIPARVGIYNHDSGIANKYYQVLPLLGGNPTSAQLGMMAEFFWGAFEKGIFDSEHDLYQYNFMGHTGRFYVKNIGINALEVVKLDNDNSIKIEVDFTFNSSTTPPLPVNRYVINKFTLYDDKGYKYIFDVKETTTETGSSATIPFGNIDNSVITSSEPITYTSAFQLSQVFDTNEKEIVKISYQDDLEVTAETTSVYNYFRILTTEKRVNYYMSSLYNYHIWGLLPKRAFTHKLVSVATKKMLELRVTNKAKIGFTLANGRNDTNINSNASVLSDMVVKNWAGDIVKQIKFSYDYATINHTGTGNIDNTVSRLILSGVSEWNKENSNTISYACHYKNQNISTQRMSSDYWGYYRSFGPGRETDPEYCTTGVLTQLDLPTKGRIVFDFGPNTYSYIGNTAVTDFRTISYDSPELVQIPLNPGQSIGDATIDLDPFSLESSAFIPISGDSDGAFRLMNTTNSDEEGLDSFGFSGFNDGGSSRKDFKLNNSWTYKIQYSRTNTTASSVSQVYHFKGLPVDRTDKWLYGGGVRINKISYFSDDSQTPSKEKHFSYQFFSDASRSSGALTFAKPVFEYKQSRQTYVPENPLVTFGAPEYDTSCSFNNLLVLRTKGSDVGYKNVMVWETGNGKSEYTYTSPIDYPESLYTISYPFIPPVNVDFKRGLLTNEKHYSQSGSAYKAVAETIYTYTPENEMNETWVRIGLRAANVAGDCPGAQNFDLYSSFMYCLDISNNCQPLGWQNLCNSDDYLGSWDINVAYGWPRLKQKVNKEYFYPQANDQRTLTTTETFTYNFQNKRLSSSTVTNSVGEVLTTEYTYDANTAGRNRIGEIKTVQTKRGTNLLDKKEITYSNSLWGSGNTAFLPSTIAIAKGTTASETRLNFVKYDEYSNPVEAKLENGTPVVYVWGYDNSLPVAIIENISYTGTGNVINSTINTLINDVKTASVQNAVTYTETNLLNKLAALRAGLPASTMVTTLTYKPLVGVSTMTDAKGVITHYYYDEFNRLKTTTDADNYILSENEYNYKP